jgi:hypothetical protein
MSWESAEHQRAVFSTTKQPGRSEGETAVPLKPSAKQLGVDNGRLPSQQKIGDFGGERGEGL